MKVTILGPQGSGKSTQAALLSSELGLPLIDMGQLIRNSCLTETPSNIEACKAIENGELVPSGYASGLLRFELLKGVYKNGFVLDGYPRKLEDVQIFDPNPDLVIYLNVSDNICVKRLLDRKRFDDTKEKIAKRLSWYHEKTSKVLSYYEEKGKLVEVSAGAGVKEVFGEIFRKLKT